MKLEGKVAIVTGASKGIGKEIAVLFANEGAQVIGLDVTDLEYTNANVEGMILDVSKFADCDTVYDAIIAKYGKVDILVNNAGITKDSLTAKMTEEMWDVVVDVNLKGVFNLTRLVGPQMSSNKLTMLQQKLELSVLQKLGLKNLLVKVNK